jgi:hypothetical protein
MKIQIARPACVLLFSMLVIGAHAQPFTSHKLTAQEIKLRAGLPVSENVGSKLSPAQKAKAADRGQAMAALILKAILHRSDPAKYPMDVTTASVEKNIWQAVERMTPSMFDTISVKAKQTLDDPAKKAALLGKYNDLNFQESSLLGKIKMKSGIEFTATADVNQVTKLKDLKAVDTYDKVDIELKSIDCIARTTHADPYDRLVLTGLLLGASGNTNDANSLAGCEMVDGLTCPLGGHRFGTYSLNTTPGFPKTFYAIFVLISSKRPDLNQSKNIFDVIMSLISPASVSPAQSMDEMVVAVTECINNFYDVYTLSDFPMIPYAVKFQLNNINMSSVNNGATSDLQTGDILEFGNPQRWGKYRITFNWRLRK